MMELPTRLLRKQMLGVGVVIVGLGSSIVVQAGGSPSPCYKNYERSCAKLHADENRVCTSGSNAIPCGDVIISDAPVNDIRTAHEGEQGNQDPIQFPCGTATVEIHVFACSGGVCNSQGVHQKTCQGRCAEGPVCDGQVVPK